MNMFDDLKKQMEESSNRWKEINELLEELQTSEHKDSKLLKLITLVIEQIRPAYSPDAIEKGIFDMFTGGTKNGK